MGYWRPMGYGMHFPAHQVGGLVQLWDITGYGFSQVWVMTGSTVIDCYPSEIRALYYASGQPDISIKSRMNSIKEHVNPNKM